MAIFVNGPVNVVRLEGEINGVKKVLYVFMDHHRPVQYQTQCDNLFSVDITQYLVNSFSNLDGSKIVDFFLEISPTHIGKNSPSMPNYRDKYIREVGKLFKKLFTLVDSKVKVSDTFQFVRLHYADIRDYFEDHFFVQMQDIGDMIGRLQQNFDLMEPIISQLKTVKASLDISADILGKTSMKPVATAPIIRPKGFTETDIDTMRRLAYKIRFSYHNDHIRDMLVKILDAKIKLMHEVSNSLTELVTQLQSDWDNLITHKDHLTESTIDPGYYQYGLDFVALRKIANNADDMFSAAFTKLLLAFVGVMDVYFLRRFLDKEYITYALTYTGATHSSNYIEILVKYFGFKVTNTAYVKTNIADLMEQIKSRPDTNSLTDLLLPPFQSQCSDLSGFPKDFD